MLNLRYSSLPTILLFLFTGNDPLYCQNENNIWYFGYNCGLDFNSGSPVFLSNGQVNSYEGGSAVSDKTSGQLLFYTDGINVWDQNHNQMPNGTGLYGYSFSSSPALIIPYPDSADVYYIFTTTGNNMPANTLSYSLVDMSLNSGLGDVTIKNQLLLNPASEKLAAVSACGGNIWVIAHELQTNNFYSYQLTPNGINLPVISSEGTVNQESKGWLKLSPDGTKLALAVTECGSDIVEIFDFDNSTGVVSDPVSLPVSGNHSYGVCFSPDNTKLYVSGFEFCTNEEIYQYDISSGDPAVIAASKTWIATYIYFGAMQNGPDGKIYIAEDLSNYLGVINYPDLSGAACGYVEDGFYLDGNMSSHGLPNLLISKNGNSMTDSLIVNSKKCYGAGYGNSAVIPSGGLAPYMFNWSDGQTGSTAYFSSTGAYYVTVTESGGCTLVDTAVITEPTALTLNVTAADISCRSSNGTASASATGGVSPYSFSWSTGVSASTITGLSAGGYEVTLTDGNNCTKPGVALISNTGSPTVTVTGTNNICFGDSAGTAAAAASGGSPPYTYLWSNGSSSTALNGLPGGTYFVSVTDTTGCMKVGYMNITTPDSMSALIIESDAFCGNANGTASVNASGGTPPFTYLWSAGSSTSAITNLDSGLIFITVTDGNGCYTVAADTIFGYAGPLMAITIGNVSCNGLADGYASVNVAGGSAPYTYEWSGSRSGSTIIGLNPGTYYITLTDGTSCSSTDSAAITQPQPLAIILNINDITCTNPAGSINALVTGGVSPYIYAWSTGETTSAITGLTAGTYGINVTDLNGCSAGNYTTLGSGVAIYYSTMTFPASCGMSNGMAIVIATGGTPPYTYLWSDGSINDTLFNVSNGSYSVIISDTNGCNVTAAVSISETSGPAAVTGFVLNVSCNGGSNGSIYINVANGNPPYSFQWSNGASTQNITGLTAGGYTITVTDNKGCTATTGATITEPVPITTEMSSVSSGCTGGGSAAVQPSGDNPPFSYKWNTGSMQPVIANLQPGVYFVTVTDSNECSKTDSVAVALNGSITAMVTGINEICAGTPVQLLAEGGGTYLWNTGETSQIITSIPLQTTVYMVTATLGNCSDSATFTVLANPAVNIDAQNDTSIYIGNGVTVRTVVAIGTPPYTYLWSTGSGDPNIYVTPATSERYYVTVTDSKGCSAFNSVLIDVIPCDAEVFVPNVFAPDCNCRDERFMVFSDCITAMRLFIYDRWGEKVFEYSGSPLPSGGAGGGFGWDGKYKGKPLDAGTYVFILKYTTINKPDEELVKEGNVHLIR